MAMPRSTPPTASHWRRRRRRGTTSSAAPPSRRRRRSRRGSGTRGPLAEPSFVLSRSAAALDVSEVEKALEALKTWPDRRLRAIVLLATFTGPVSYTHLRAHETRHDLVCRL